MKNFGLKFHHLGLATDNPKLTLKILQNIGYKATKTRSNKNYNVKNIKKTIFIKNRLMNLIIL